MRRAGAQPSVAWRAHSLFLYKSFVSFSSICHIAAYVQPSKRKGAICEGEWRGWGGRGGGARGVLRRVSSRCARPASPKRGEPGGASRSRGGEQEGTHRQVKQVGVPHELLVARSHGFYLCSAGGARERESVCTSDCANGGSNLTTLRGGWTPRPSFQATRARLSRRAMCARAVARRLRLFWLARGACTRADTTLHSCEKRELSCTIT